MSGKEALYQHARMALVVLLRRCTLEPCGTLTNLPAVPTGADKHVGRLLLHMVEMVRSGPLNSADADWVKSAASVAANAANAMFCYEMSTAHAWDARWSIVLLRWRVVDATLSLVGPSAGKHHMSMCWYSMLFTVGRTPFCNILLGSSPQYSLCVETTQPRNFNHATTIELLLYNQTSMKASSLLL
jgi:hypothetical protein